MNNRRSSGPDRQYDLQIYPNRATAFERNGEEITATRKFETAGNPDRDLENGVSLLVSMFYMYLRPFDPNQRAKFFLFLLLQYLKRRLFLLYISKRCGKTSSTYTPK
jgi:hypothetical protein